MCLSPFKPKGQDIPVPCGKCPKCTARRTSGWSFRLMQQDKISMLSSFVTLTYDTDHVPITPHGFLTLVKRDCQLFFKRLRDIQKRLGSPEFRSLKISYYLAGEYGGQFGRPHYHVILFNAESRLIEMAWPLGQCHVGTVTGASIGYTLKYISKPAKIPLHQRDDRQREFSLMSKDWVPRISESFAAYGAANM